MSEPVKTRRRGAELVNAIYDAAIDELVELGIGRLTMEGIARRAGTAKTSLYRRWPDTHELLLAAFYHHMPQEVPSPSADDLRGDLIAALNLMRDWLATPAARGMAGIVTARHLHPELADRLFAEVFDPRGSRFTLTVLRHYADRGEFDPARLTPVVANIGEALLIKVATDENRLPGEADIIAIVDQAIMPALGILNDR
ncbi:MAG: TetR/AcrR family transcriptional regulator [Stackebrandtia sp.]